MGSKFRTMLNLEVIKSDLENNLIYVKGSIPGSKNSIVYLRKSLKLINKKTTQEKEDQVKQTVSKKDTPKGAAKKQDSKTKDVKTPEKKNEVKKK